MELGFLVQNIENPTVQQLIKNSPDVIEKIQEMQEIAFEAQRVEHPEGDASKGTLVRVDDGLGSQDDPVSGPLGMVLAHADPYLAAGTAVFGLGIAVLPLLDGMGPGILGGSKAEAGQRSIFVYDRYARSKKSPTLFFTESELRKTLGPVEPASLAAELLRDDAQAAAHAREFVDFGGEEEVGRLQAWTEHARRSVRALRRRSALAFLGLSASATVDEISRVYKRMALELHPDKGGDAEQFQQLQEMRDRLIDAKQEEEDEEAAAAKREEECAVGEHEVCRRWTAAHREAVRIWERSQVAAEEIRGGGLTGTDSHPAMRRLRQFVDMFVAREVRALKHGAEGAAIAKLKLFVLEGAVLLAAAALADSAGAASILATSLNYRLVARSGSQNVALMCDRVLAAVAEVPRHTEAFLDAIERERTVVGGVPSADPSFDAPERPDSSGDLGNNVAEAQDVSVSSADPTSVSEYLDSRVSDNAAEVSAPLATSACVNDAQPANSCSSEVSRAAETQQLSPRGAACALDSEALQRYGGDTPRDLSTDCVVRTEWDPSFTHPYVGTLQGSGTGIFCRPCRRWIPTRDFDHEVFLRHAEASHPTCPLGWAPKVS